MLHLDFPVYFELSKLRFCEKLLKENTNLSNFVTLDRVYQIFFYINVHLNRGPARALRQVHSLLLTSELSVYQ